MNHNLPLFIGWDIVYDELSMSHLTNSLSSIASQTSLSPLLPPGSVTHANDIDPQNFIQFHFQIGFFRESVTVQQTNLTLQTVKELACLVLEKQV